MNIGQDLIDRLTAGLKLVEDGLLVLLLSTMIGLAAYQVIARNFFDTGILWGDASVRVLVLWVTFIGATIASRNDEHIRMDILTRFIKPGSEIWMKRFRNLFTAAITGVFAWFSLQFVLLDFADEITAFASVPAWACEVVMPAAAGLMSIRYLIHTVNPP